MVSVRLPRRLVNDVLAQAQQQPQQEICGLIAARDGRPCSLYPITNRLHSPSRFHMDEAEQISAFRQMRDAGETLFAIYHSHPHSAALPSATDLRESAYPDALYLIISLDTKGVLELRGFRLNDQRAMEIALELDA